MAMRIETDPRLLKTRFSRWLEDQMDERDMPQLTLAGKSGVSQGHISGILRAGKFPEDDKVKRLARALQADAEEALAAVYLDRIERVLESAPASTRALFKKLLQ